MIYCLTGKIVKKSLNAVVLSCGGVGYYTQCPASVAGALPGVGQEATLYTVMSVTENDVSLYGFATEEQQACFEMLTAVSGVGPKVGLLQHWCRWATARARQRWPSQRSMPRCRWKRSSSWPCAAWQAGGKQCRTIPRCTAQK